MYESEILHRWSHPSDYGGHSPDGDYMMCGQSRDSDALERSNYERICEDLVKKAIAKKREILDGFFPRHLPDEIDKAVRAKFKIHLSEKAVGL